MKSRNSVHISLLHKAQAPSRFLWMGLIFCLPWIVGAQAPISEPTTNSSEQKAAVDEKTAQAAEPAAKPAEPIATVAAEPAQPVTAPAVEPLAKIIQDPPAAPSAPIAQQAPKTVEPVAQETKIVTEPVVESVKPAAEPSAPAIVAQPAAKPVAAPTVQAKSPEKSPPLCRMPNPAEPAVHRPLNVSTIGMAPLSHGNLELDWLYWQASADSLRFAMTNNSTNLPSADDLTPENVPSMMVDQKFGYNPGLRASVVVPILYDEWEIGAVYTRFYSSSPSKHVSDPDGDIFTILDNTTWNANTSLTEGYSAKAKWSLKINAFDFEFRRPFVLGKSLMLQPVMGAKACFVRNLWDVYYVSTDLGGQVNSVNPPQVVTFRSSLWCVGPKFGAAMRFLIPKQISLSIATDFALMVGNFKGATKYSQLIGLPDTVSTFKSRKTRLHEVQRIECAISKWWSIKNDSSLELTAGYEVQYWWRQMRTTSYASVANPPGGSDLSLQGPFLRGSWNF